MWLIHKLFPNLNNNYVSYVKTINQALELLNTLFYKVILLVTNTTINFQVYAFGTVEREQQTLNVPQFIIISWSKDATSSES